VEIERRTAQDYFFSGSIGLNPAQDSMGHIGQHLGSAGLLESSSLLLLLLWYLARWLPFSQICLWALDKKNLPLVLVLFVSRRIEVYSPWFVYILQLC